MGTAAGNAPGTMVLDGSMALGPQTRCGAFAAWAQGRGGSVKAEGNGVTTIEVRGVGIAPGPDRFHVSARFKWERLGEVELCMLRAEDGTTWADWTFQGEMERKRRHEAWARLAFGVVLEPLAFDLGEGAGKVMPDTIGPEHPRTAAFAWGEVASLHDGKGGSTFLRVRYADADGAGPVTA